MSHSLRCCKHKHAPSHHRANRVQLQGRSSTVFLPRWFDYGTYLPTAERREQIAHRWASLPVCFCVRVHLPFSALLWSGFVSLYLSYLSWHANPSVWRCEMWVLASDWEEIWAAVIFGFGIPLSLSLPLGLTSDGKDLACRLLTKPQLCMIRELNKRMLRPGLS